MAPKAGAAGSRLSASPVTDWTIDYGDGPRPCKVPHNWTGEADLRWEGPALYCATVDCGSRPGWLLFHGASYRAEVSVDSAHVLSHVGIWDSFSVPLPPGRHVIEVEVTKNGGESFPVPEVLSGFLPYVYGTFGGLFREVELLDHEPNLEPEAPSCRIRVEGTRLTLDSDPWEMRGALSWGWYPEAGSPHPGPDQFRTELLALKVLGLNTLKACLWLPSHRAMEIIEEEGMLAWLELPLWMPATDEGSLDRALSEVERIVRQYRRHRCIVAWTFGCELSCDVPHHFRRRLVELGASLTGAALLKDNSGGSEMYGGDLREYGTFEDFHPYCDAQWYPPVMDALRQPPRYGQPILLGEFNDYDVLRPLARVRDEYWASDDPAKNDMGVRWQTDLPRLIARGTQLEDEKTLAQVSASKGRWMRRHAVRCAMSQPGVQGYVLTGIADTPISTSGVIEPGRFRPGDFSADTVFLVPPRQLPWTHGGNRPGWLWPYVQEAGEAVVRVAIRSEVGYRGLAKVCTGGRTLFEGKIALDPGSPAEIAQVAFGGEHGARVDLAVHWNGGEQSVEVQFWRGWEGGASFSSAAAAWLRVEPGGEGPLVALDTDEAAGAAVVLATAGPGVPFFRECVHRGVDLLMPSHAWDSWLCVAASYVLDLQGFAAGGELTPIVQRIDTRTFEERDVVAARPGQVFAALRPGGGEGVQPTGLNSNPAGAEVLRRLLALAG
ncbi:MAG: hypothetical protein AB7F50_08785 [Fimbriimonadaceae bacterium]